jgi:hypothetical protein
VNHSAVAGCPGPRPGGDAAGSPPAGDARLSALPKSVTDVDLIADVPWVQVLEGDASALPLENNRVDRARADRTLQDVEDPSGVFDEIHRVPRPDGIAVVADFDWARGSIDGDEEPGLAFNEHAITQAIRNAAIGRQLRWATLGAGFDVVEIRQKPVLIDEFDYADKLLGLTDNTNERPRPGTRIKQPASNGSRSCRSACSSPRSRCSSPWRANPARADQTVGEGTGALRPRGMWPTRGRRRNILADHDVRGPDRRVRTSGPRRPSTSWACSSEQSRGWK